MTLPIVPIALALAQFAPTVLRYFGVGDESVGVADKVAEVAQVVSGTKTPQDALAAITASQDLQNKFRLAIVENETELLRIYMADRDSARRRDETIIKSGRWNWRADFLAFLAVGGLMLSVWLIARDATLPERAVNAIMFVAGVLASAVRDVYGFEFGTSRGSEQKQATIDDLLRRKV